jgi:hypothetical protein
MMTHDKVELLKQYLLAVIKLDDDQITFNKETVKDMYELIYRLEDESELYIRKLQERHAEIERLTKEIETVRGAFLEICDLRSDISKELKKTRRELNQCKKDLLKSKKYKFVRNPNRIYSIMDFEDGEILEFEDFPGNSVAIANGYGMFKGKEDTRLVNFDEVEEISQELDEFVEKLKTKKCHYCETEHTFDFDGVTVEDIDETYKEMVGEQG